MRMLVLGASGFLGLHVVEAAAAHREIALASHFHARLGARDGPMLDLVAATASELQRFLDEAAPQAIVNCVGATGGDTSHLEALNVTLVARLLAAARNAVPGVRFVQIGSAAEYGATLPHEAVTETQLAEPLTEYGRTKLRATRLTLDASSDGNIDGVVLRVFNPIGQGMPANTLAGNAARQMRAAEAGGLRLGPLDAWRDFVDARDVAAAALLASTIEKPGDRLFNVGSGAAVRARDMVHRLAAIAAFTGAIHEGATGSSRSQALSWQQADIRLAARELGWQPRFSLDDALSALWHGLLEDPIAAPSREH